MIVALRSFRLLLELLRTSRIWNFDSKFQEIMYNKSTFIPNSQFKQSKTLATTSVLQEVTSRNFFLLETWTIITKQQQYRCCKYKLKVTTKNKLGQSQETQTPVWSQQRRANEWNFLSEFFRTVSVPQRYKLSARINTTICTKSVETNGI